MASRLALILLAAFWVVMNALLWRTEFGASSELGGLVPVEMVWEKLRQAPDESRLGIFRHGARIGFCKWTTGASDTLNRLSEDSPVPDDTVPVAADTTLRFEGNFTLKELAEHLRFDGSLQFGTNQSWETLSLRVSLPPAAWEVQAVAATQTVRFVEDDGEERTEKQFRFQDLARSGRWLPGVLARFGGKLPPPAAAPAALPNRGLKWEARQANLLIGTTPVRVFRVQTRLLDQYPVVLYVSRAGQVLRLELPAGLLLLDDRIIHL